MLLFLGRYQKTSDNKIGKPFLPLSHSYHRCKEKMKGVFFIPISKLHVFLDTFESFHFWWLKQSNIISELNILLRWQSMLCILHVCVMQHFLFLTTIHHHDTFNTYSTQIPTPKVHTLYYLLYITCIFVGCGLSHFTCDMKSLTFIKFTRQAVMLMEKEKDSDSDDGGGMIYLICSRQAKLFTYYIDSFVILFVLSCYSKTGSGNSLDFRTSIAFQRSCPI